jgi:hypothetical protein
MAFPWAIAAQVVAAAAKAYEKHRQAQNDAAERERLRDEIIAAITRMRQEIITDVVSLRILELEGNVEGYETTYAAYDADPDSTVEENRLVRLVDDSAQDIGQLGRLIDTIRAMPDAGLAAWPPYLSLLYLRAQAMTEREVTYGADEIEDILPTFEIALQRMYGVIQYQRDISDARFGAVVTRQHPDFTATIVGYMFEHNFMFCGYLDRPDAIELANEQRERHMDSAYFASEGVREAHEAIDELQGAIDDLNQGWLIGQLATLDPEIQKYVKRMADGRVAFRGGLPVTFEARRHPFRSQEAA